MAIDTRDKRASVIGWAFPSRAVLPNPDAAAEGQLDRQQLAYSYRAALTAAADPGTVALVGSVMGVALGGSDLRPGLAGSAAGVALGGSAAGVHLAGSATGVSLGGSK